MSTPKYDPAEMARRGDEWFAKAIGAQVAKLPPSQILAIDVDTGDYEVAETPVLAARALRTRHPNAQVFIRRVGSTVLHRLGGARRKRDA